jgi:hypothetical protein
MLLVALALLLAPYRSPLLLLAPAAEAEFIYIIMFAYDAVPVDLAITLSGCKNGSPADTFW